MRLRLDVLRSYASSLFARVALILISGLLAAQLAGVWLQSGERAKAVSQARGLSFADRIAEAVRMLEAANGVGRNATLAALQTGDMRVSLITDEQVSPNIPRGQIQSLIGERLGSEREIRSTGGGGGMQQHGSGMRSFDVRLMDGQWVRIAAQREAEVPALPANLVASLLITVLIVMAVVMLAVRQISEPLRQLSEAADALGQDLDAPPLAEAGSAETRRAAQAFNRMQARIRRLIDDRARALAAVSHDLRTPLTRMRLRAEMVEDAKLRDDMAADLDAMAVMIDSTLEYMRVLQDNEVVRRIDMNALLQSLAEDASLLGRKISVAGLVHAPYPGRLTALRRALQNLIDNAFKYGNGAQIRVNDEAMALRITVEDDGPGIPPEELGRVAEPFYRPDASRSRETGGVGLGLSIVKDIALLHGGELVLENRDSGGLSASIVLPRVSAA